MKWIIVLVMCNMAFAQIKATTDTGKAVLLNNDGTWKYIEAADAALAMLDIPSKREFKHPPWEVFGDPPKYHLNEGYSTRRDSTSVQVSIHLDQMDLFRYQVIGAKFSYPGEVTTPPTQVTVFFESETPDQIYHPRRTCRFLTDSQSFDPPPLTSYGVARTALMITEYMETILPTEDFLRIVNAKKVELQLNDNKVILAEPQLEALRDFASRMR